MTIFLNYNNENLLYESLTFYFFLAKFGYSYRLTWISVQDAWSTAQVGHDEIEGRTAKGYNDLSNIDYDNFCI